MNRRGDLRGPTIAAIAGIWRWPSALPRVMIRPMIAVDTREPFFVWTSKIVFLVAMIGGVGCGISVLLASILGFHLHGQIAAGSLGTLVAATATYGVTRQKLRALFAGRPQHPALVDVDAEDEAPTVRRDLRPRSSR